MVDQQSESIRSNIHNILKHLSHNPDAYTSLLEGLETIKKARSSWNMLSMSTAVGSIGWNFLGSGAVLSANVIYQAYGTDKEKLLVGLLENGLLEEIKEVDSQSILKIYDQAMALNPLKDVFRDVFKYSLELAQVHDAPELKALAALLIKAITKQQNLTRSLNSEMKGHDFISFIEKAEKERNEIIVELIKTVAESKYKMEFQDVVMVVIESLDKLDISENKKNIEKVNALDEYIRDPNTQDNKKEEYLRSKYKLFRDGVNPLNRLKFALFEKLKLPPETIDLAAQVVFSLASILNKTKEIDALKLAIEEYHQPTPELKKNKWFNPKRLMHVLDKNPEEQKKQKLVQSVSEFLKSCSEEIKFLNEVIGSHKETASKIIDALIEANPNNDKVILFKKMGMTGKDVVFALGEISKSNKEDAIVDYLVHPSKVALFKIVKDSKLLSFSADHLADLCKNTHIVASLKKSLHNMSPEVSVKLRKRASDPKRSH